MTKNLVVDNTPAINSSRKKRACKLCHCVGHDIRNCPQNPQTKTLRQDYPDESLTTGCKRGPKAPKRQSSSNTLSQIPEDDEGISDDGFESDDEPDVADDDAEINEDDDENEELPDKIGDIPTEILPGVSLQYTAIDLTREEVESEPSIPSVEAHMQNVPEFKPRRRLTTGYLPHSINYEHIPKDAESEWDFFHLFLTDEILEQFVDSSNAYAAAKIPKAEWKQDITTFEMLTFLGIILYLGIIKYPSMEDAWSSDVAVGHPYLRSAMQFRRFKQILRSWHWVDTSIYSAEERKQMNKESPFWAVEEFVSKLSDRFAECYFPGQFLSVDEQCFAFKGRHRCRCYNPNKPNKWHFKAFALNDAMTGYQLGHFMYEGKDVKRDEVPGDLKAILGDRKLTATEYPVVRLLSSSEFHFQNFIVGLDNWYTGTILFIVLALARGMHLVGTVKGNRAGLPKDLLFEDKERKPAVMQQWLRRLFAGKQNCTLQHGKTTSQ